MKKQLVTFSIDKIVKEKSFFIIKNKLKKTLSGFVQEKLEELIKNNGDSEN